MRRRLYLLLSLIVAIIVLLTGCKAPKPTPTVPSGKIVLYTSMPEKIAAQVVKEFQAANPAITVDVYRAGTGDVLAKLQTEMEAGAVMADVLWVAEPTVYLDLKEDGKLLSIHPPAAADVDSQYYDSDGFFYGVGVVHMAIVYNTSLVQDSPKSWKELLDPKWKGKIALPRPLNSGAAVHAVGTMVAHPDFGWEYFEGLKANGAVAVGGPSDVVKKVAEGEFAVGMTQAPLTRRMAAKGSPVATSWPSDGALRKTTVIAVLKDSKNPAAAADFVNFIISEAGQKALAAMKVYYPIRPGIEPPAGEPPVEDIPALPNDFDFIRKNRDEIITKFDEIFD